MTYVRDVEIVDEPCEVFDVEVEHDASFIVEGVVLHNSEICRGFDGRVYKLKDPKKPTPPLHPNCRSTFVPWLPGQTRLSYEQWLKTQNEQDQNDILGNGKADLWRAGQITLADIVRDDRSTLTLDELRKKLAPTETP